MARSHARILCSIWADEDWRSLSPLAQWAYCLVLSQPGLTLCGVVTYTPKRWTMLATGITTRQVEKAFDELVANRFVVIDEDTEELFIRSFVKNDGVLSSPNLRKAMWTAYRDVVSKRIKEGFLEGLPEGFRDEFRQPGPEPIAEPLGNPSPIPQEPPPEPKPIATSDDVAASFEEFWLAYPKARRLAKPEALKAFKLVVRKTPAEAIIAGAARYSADPNRLDEFTPYPQKWLKQERWNAPPELPRTNGSARQTREASTMGALAAMISKDPQQPHAEVRELSA